MISTAKEHPERFYYYNNGITIDFLRFIEIIHYNSLLLSRNGN